MGLLRTLLLIVIAICSTIFVVQNLASVEVSFLTWSITAPRGLVFSLLLLTGGLGGYLAHALKMALRPRRLSDRAGPPTPPLQPG